MVVTDDAGGGGDSVREVMRLSTHPSEQFRLRLELEAKEDAASGARWQGRLKEMLARRGDREERGGGSEGGVDKGGRVPSGKKRSRGGGAVSAGAV
jgi:hypothetical protein